MLYAHPAVPAATGYACKDHRTESSNVRFAPISTVSHLGPTDAKCQKRTLASAQILTDYGLVWHRVKDSV